MLKVAYDARFLDPKTRHTGPGVFTETIVRRLSGDVRFIGLSYRFQGASELGIKTWPRIPKMNSLLLEASPLLLGAYDVYWGTCHLIPALVKKPSVLTVHDLLMQKHRKDDLRSRFLAWRLRSSLRRAKKVVTDSRTTADDLLALFPEIAARTEVIHLGFDAPHNGSAEPVAKGLSQRLPYMVMLGAHHPRKNLSLAAETMARINDDEVKVRLFITSFLDPSFQELVERHRSYLTTLGVVDKQQVFALLRGAVALLSPSKYEGFGLPVLEAMAACCPVLALDTPINREIAGGAAWLLPEDATQWAKAVKHLLQSSSIRAEMVEKGLENLKRFSWAKTTAAYIQAFKDVAK